MRVRGLVQGVGFRPFVYRLAVQHGLTGWVRNDAQGVLAEVQGEACGAFLSALSSEAPPLARVDGVEPDRIAISLDDRGFVIDESTRGGAVSAAIGPDAAPCSACLGELFDRSARRYLYPFLNCTHCGPRYTITRALPYDRPQTSMAAFPLCDACAAEFHDPADRRFHAQPIACPACGPRLSVEIPLVARAIREGRIVALKGVGGFLLACDARRGDVVAELRRRKDREAKPFACMVANVASARRLAEISDEEERLLTSTERPIVLVRRRGAGGLDPEVAPHLEDVGLMLPSSPLHHVLFHALAGAPDGTAWLSEPQDAVLVMTSANPGGEPLVIDDAEATARLAGIADLVVTHGRDVVVRNDDSVLRVVRGGPTFVRRARGFVPVPIRLPFEAPPVLALGAHLKTTVCLVRGREAWVSQHVGDLDDAATLRFLDETIEHLTRTLDVKPIAVAHDLHPELATTRRALETGLPTIGVQHHHAHLAAVMAEYGLRERAVGVILDGYGYGRDGEAWGGELLFTQGGSVGRAGHLRPLRLPGGDAAARAPWRMAAAALSALGRQDEILSRFGRFGAKPALLDMLERGVRAPWTTSAGRLFDAACGLLGVCEIASYEGEAPMRLEALVTRPKVLEGAWRVDGGVLDLLPLLAALDGRSPGDGADVFHGTLAAALVDWALPEVRRHGDGRVVLSGGCFLNRVLTERVAAGFEREGVEVLLPRRVPANDGGLSLGQAYVAALGLVR